MDILKLADEFIKATEGLVSVGGASQEVAGGTYEIQMKPYHLPEIGGINLYSIEELSIYKYDWLTEKQIEHMMQLDEFPLNIRTTFTGDEKTLLTETYMYLEELPDRGDIEDIITYDLELIADLQGG